MTYSILKEKIFKIRSEEEFNSLALEIFSYQYHGNRVYKLYCDALGRSPEEVSSVDLIPFLPISLFRNRNIITGSRPEEILFKSSGTTGTLPGVHKLTDISLYEKSFTECFKIFYGDPADVVILALLPSYIERGESSLVYMAEKLISLSSGGDGGFYLNDYKRLIEDIKRYKAESRKIVLLGVTYALLDLAETFSPDLNNIIVMETGGMKGRRKELTRNELHKILSRNFGCNLIHSEYGMTELLSQAYSDGRGLFKTPPWMRIVIRDMYDPLARMPVGSGGGVNVIDLANLNSCSFIETSDLGLMHTDSSFEITGRFDNSDIRGCNLLVF